MNEMLPIVGKIPTYVTVKEQIPTYEDSDVQGIIGIIHGSGEDRIDIFPPHPLEFTEENYKPMHRDTSPITLGELYGKIQAAPQDSLLVILEYDRLSNLKKFHVEPMEIISNIDYSKDENELGLYSVYYEDGKMIECSQLQSAFCNVSDGKVSMLKRLHNKVIPVPENTPVFLFSKTEGKLNVTDMITFRSYAAMSEKNYIGIVVEEDVFIPDFIYDEE